MTPCNCYACRLQWYVPVVEKPMRLTDQERMHRATPERDVVRGVMEHFQARGGYCWRQNTGAVVSEYNGSKRLIRYGERGSSDVLGIYRGRLYAIECKTELGKRTPEQIAWQQRIVEHGGIALVCRPSSWQEVIDRAMEGL